MTDVAPAASENTDAVTNDELVDELRSWLEENWDPDLTVADWWQRLGLAGSTARLLARLAPVFVVLLAIGLVERQIIFRFSARNLTRNFRSLADQANNFRIDAVYLITKLFHNSSKLSSFTSCGGGSSSRLLSPK